MNDPILPEELPAPAWDVAVESISKPGRPHRLSDRSLGLMAAAALAVGGVALIGATQPSEATITVPLIDSTRVQIPDQPSTKVPTILATEPMDSVLTGMVELIDMPDWSGDDCPGCGMG